MKITDAEIARVANRITDQVTHSVRGCLTKGSWEATEAAVTAVLMDERRETYVFTVKVRADSREEAYGWLSPLEAHEGLEIHWEIPI